MNERMILRELLAKRSYLVPSKLSSPKEIVGHHGHRPHGSSIRWPALYEHLRAKGMKKSKAAAISNGMWRRKHGLPQKSVPGSHGLVGVGKRDSMNINDYYKLREDVRKKMRRMVGGEPPPIPRGEPVMPPPRKEPAPPGGRPPAPPRTPVPPRKSPSPKPPRKPPVPRPPSPRVSKMDKCKCGTHTGTERNGKGMKVCERCGKPC